MGRKMKDSGVEWIGEIPEDWTLAELKFFAHVNNGREIENEVNGNEPNAIPVYGSGGVFKYTDNFLHDGEVVMFGRKGTLGKPIYVKGKFWVVDTMYYLTHNETLNPKYNYYLLSSFDWTPHITQTALPSIVASQIIACKFPIPPINEQQLICNKLDVLINEVDRAKEKADRAILAYKSLKQSLITRAVTKGVRGKREMKDSGIEWIGEIPADWDVTRIKFLFELRNERNFLPLEEVNLISLYTDKGVIQHDDLEKTTGNKASNADGYKIVCKNDIVVNIILCWMGAIGRSAYEGVTSPAYDVYIPNADVDSRFYHHYFRTTGFNGDCYKRGKGIMAMRWRTYAEQFRDIKVVHPPMEEQQEILRYLDEKCSAIDTLIAKKEQLLSELETYKKSLIYEYVTGKREVPA